MGIACVCTDGKAGDEVLTSAEIGTATAVPTIVAATAATIPFTGTHPAC